VDKLTLLKFVERKNGTVERPLDCFISGLILAGKGGYGNAEI